MCSISRAGDTAFLVAFTTRRRVSLRAHERVVTNRYPNTSYCCYPLVFPCRISVCVSSVDPSVVAFVFVCACVSSVGLSRVGALRLSRSLSSPLVASFFSMGFLSFCVVRAPQAGQPSRAEQSRAGQRKGAQPFASSLHLTPLNGWGLVP